VTACAIQTGIFLLRNRLRGSTTIVVAEATADIQSPVAMARTSIFETGNATRLVPYRHSFSRADRGTTATTSMNVAQDAVIID